MNSPNIAERVFESALGYAIDWSATAGWVQGLFSVLAILAAGSFAVKEGRDKRAAAMDAFHGIVAQVPRAIERALDELTTPTAASQWGIPDTSWFADAEKMLQEVSVFELGANKGAAMVSELLHVLRTSKELFENTYVLQVEPVWLIRVFQAQGRAEGLFDRVNDWRAARNRSAKLWYLPWEGH